MKYLFALFFSLVLSIVVIAQPEDPKTMHQTARTFMMSGDFDNAILVLNRALTQDKNNLEMQKDLVQCFYFKKDYVKAVEGVKALIDRDDADVITFQIAGNVYKALEEAKECEKVYKKGLKKFPKSGPLYSEYGELLWAKTDYSAIDQWEKGIEVDPGYGGNYYNAAVFYFYTKEKVWSLIYGEIFVNMESLSERGANIKQLLLQGYKEKLFAEADLLKGEEKNKSEFAKTYLTSMGKLSSLASKGINTETLIMIRSRFILDWYANNAGRFPFRLFDFQRQLLQEGMFEAYNHWLFGPIENLAAYENWTKTHNDQYAAFTNFQKTRVFRMPAGQYYQAK
ncbi:MAG TPA: tetratricopeptide repeat protein [Chitinophagaceae bacterium]